MHTPGTVGAMLGACLQGLGRQLLSAHSWDHRGSAWPLLCFVFQRHQRWQRNHRSACTGADVNSGLHETRMDRTRRKCLEVIQGDFCRKNHLYFAFWFLKAIGGAVMWSIRAQPDQLIPASLSSHTNHSWPKGCTFGWYLNFSFYQALNMQRFRF